MKEVKRKIILMSLLLAAVLTVSCVKAEEAGVPKEEIALPEAPEVPEINENNLTFVGIVETAGTAEDFN